MEYVNVKGLDKPFAKLALGTVWFEPKYQDQINELMDAYVAHGGNVIETGRFYGPTHQSESCIKEWLEKSGKRDEVILITKCCHPIITPDDQHHNDYWRVKPDLITEDLYWSLYHVGVDHFDIFSMHRDDPTVPVGPLMERLEQHRLEGKYKAFGVSNWTNDRLQEALDYCDTHGLMRPVFSSNSFSLAKVPKPRRILTVHVDENEVEWFRGKDLLLMSWASQGAGFLVDLWDENSTTCPQWIRETYFSAENFERLRRARVLAAEKGCETVNIAVAYVLCRDFPVSALIGCKNVKELESSLKALDVKLTPEEEDYLCLRRDDWK